MKAPLAILASLTAFATAIEVHEWGTFTVLSGSNGFQVPWYASSTDLALLPGFISPATMNKSGFATVRMETPVIYFYPEKEMKVSVEVSFEGGTITETFPHTRPGAIKVDPANGNSVLGSWSGTLHPPTNKAALAEIPFIPESEYPEPYGAAREVPDAWIFQSDLKEIPGLQVQPHFPQMEKFIFYRGAGNAYIPVDVAMAGDKVTLLNNSDSALPFGVALRVRNRKAAWIEIPSVAARPSGDLPAVNHAQVTLPEPDRPLDEVESELAGVCKKALAAEGLTTAEASAMVETWRRTWFRENGDRVLTIIPQKITDSLLPLKIVPAPETTQRVFVARIELLSPDREQTLLGLMNSATIPDERQFADFKSLELGRFSNGAMEIVTRIQKERMQSKFYALERFGETLKASQR